MEGRRPIVLMLRNHQFHEHTAEEGALTEARRLSRVHSGECVVYVPVLAAHPPTSAIARVEVIPRWSQPLGEMAVTDGDASTDASDEPFQAVPEGGPETRITRGDAYRVVCEAMRAWPAYMCPIDVLREEAIARLGSASLTLSARLFPRVLHDMHRAGIVTVSDGFVSLIEQP